MMRMSNYAKPYTDMTLLNDGYFKFKNGRTSIWSLEDVKYLKHHMDDGDASPFELEKKSKFNFFTISRIIATLENGGFDEYIDVENTTTDIDDFGNSIVNIYDGIHIENHYHYPSNSDKEQFKTKPKGNITAWSKRVRKRDNYTCVVCDKYDKSHMEAHHIEPKSVSPERATDDLNGVCICQSCHRKYNNRYEPKNQNMVTFARFIADERRGY